MANITKSFLDNTPLKKSGQQIFWDQKLRGFGVVIGRTAKTFVVQWDVLGRTKRKKIGRYSEALTVAKARDRAKDWLGDLQQGIVPWEEEALKRAQQTTLIEAYEQFMENKKDKKKLSPASINNYEYAITLLKSWHKKDLSHITYGDVEKKHREIGTKNGQYQANVVLRLFSVVCNYAIKRHKHITINPVTGLEWYKEERRKSAIPDDVLPVFWRLLDTHVSTPMRRDFFRVLLFTGLRKTSAASIRINDIDLKAKTLHIPNPKGGEEKAFTMPLSDYLCELIEGLLEGNNTQWLFPSRGKQGHLRDAREAALVKALKTETNHHLIVHGLRSTFITVAAKLDTNAYKIKLLVNHALPKSDVTAGYTGLDVDDLREPMQRITTKLLSLVEPEQKDNVVELKR